MSYESLEREMERRKLRRTKGDKKIERKSFPYRRGGRKGSKVRTKLNSENWSGDEESPLAKALAAARERANIVKSQLNIKNLPHRNQKSLTDFEADTRWTSSYPGELPPWCSNRNPRAIVQYPCNCGECDAEYFEAQEYGTNCDTCGGFLRDCIGHTDGETCNQAGVETRLCTKCEDDVRCDSCRRIYDYYGGDNPFCDVCSQMVPYNPVSNVGESHKGWCKWDAGYGQTAGTCETCWSEPWMWSNDLGYLSFNEGTPHYNSDIETMCLHCMEEDYPEAYEELINQIPEKESKEEIKSKKWWKFWNAEEEDDYEAEANYMKQGFDIQREGSSHYAIYYIIKGDNHIRLDYDRRTDYGNRPDAREYPYDYGEQDFSTLQEALNWFDKQIENGRVFTDFGTNSNWNAETCPMCKNDNPIIGGEVCAECTQYLEDEQDRFSQRYGAEWTGNCQRCGDRTSHNLVYGRYNTDIICRDCADKENEEVQQMNAENIRLRPIELKILQYLSQFSPDGVTRWDPPAGLTKSEIAEAVGQKSRTGVINPLNRLIEMRLVVSMQKRPPGARRVVDVFFPTYEGLKVAKKIPTQRMAETNSMDIDGDGQVENWEVQAHENNLTGLGHEETFNAPSNKDKQIEIRELAIEVLTEAKTWLWLQDLTNRIKTKTKGGHKKITTQFVSKVIGKSRGGANGFYVTPNGKIYYHGDTDRGEFIRGMF